MRYHLLLLWHLSSFFFLLSRSRSSLSSSLFWLCSAVSRFNNSAYNNSIKRFITETIFRLKLCPFLCLLPFHTSIRWFGRPFFVFTFSYSNWNVTQSEQQQQQQQHRHTALAARRRHERLRGKSSIRIVVAAATRFIFSAATHNIYSLFYSLWAHINRTI